jgi:CubicO group peptidase (beta-lactamase class C family)
MKFHSIKSKLLHLMPFVAMPPILASAQTPQNQNSSTPTVSEIHQILVDRIDTQHQGIAIVVGVIDANGRIISYGHFEKGDTRSLNGDTIFEIGSETKVFTALLLSDMVQHGEVSLDATNYQPPTALFHCHTPRITITPRRPPRWT